MIFCEHCFNDKEISAIIRGAADVKKGTCPICSKSDVYLYDTEKQNELTFRFERLLSIYEPANILLGKYPQAEAQMLVDDLKKRWNVFSEIPKDKINEILKTICSELYAKTPEIFDEKVGIPELYDEDYLNKYALLKNNDWNAFANEIKTKNRYHSKLVNFDIFEKYCTYIRKTYKKGNVFYRARISGKEGYSTGEMSAPPIGKSSEGRANAKGITCLYLANDIETTLHEVRAGEFDYVSVGKFVLKDDVVLVNLSAIASISPFIEDMECLAHAINRQCLEKIDAEMSKALRRSDSTLDYVPTQYIVDFIKSIEYDGKSEYAGIEYNSTTNRDGYNLAIFNPDIFECTCVEVYEIEKLDYKKKNLRA